MVCCLRLVGLTHQKTRERTARVGDARQTRQLVVKPEFSGRGVQLQSVQLIETRRGNNAPRLPPPPQAQRVGGPISVPGIAGVRTCRRAQPEERAEPNRGKNGTAHAFQAQFRRDVALTSQTRCFRGLGRGREGSFVDRIRRDGERFGDPGAAVAEIAVRKARVPDGVKQPRVASEAAGISQVRGEFMARQEAVVEARQKSVGRVALGRIRPIVVSQKRADIGVRLGVVRQNRARDWIDAGEGDLVVRERSPLVLQIATSHVSRRIVNRIWARIGGIVHLNRITGFVDQIREVAEPLPRGWKRV